MTAICYEQLEQIFICDLPVDTFLQELSGVTCLLALVTPCNTGGQDVIQDTPHTQPKQHP